MYHELNQTKWWRVKCVMLDCLDYISGDMTKEKFKEYVLIDLEELKKLVEAE